MVSEIRPSLNSDIMLEQSIFSAVENGTLPTQITSGRNHSKLTKARIKEKISQRQLAKSIGIDHSTISRFESGTHAPCISTVVSYAEGLGLDSQGRFSLIASLAKEEDKEYIERLLEMSVKNLAQWEIEFNTDISTANTPVDKIKDYMQRRNNKSIRQVAEQGGFHYSTLSKFLSGKFNEIKGPTFIGLTKGLGLKTKWQVLDLFDSFGAQESGIVSEEIAEEKAS